MSFCLDGRRPSSDAGRQYQRSNWTWLPLAALCQEVNRKYALAIAMDDWVYNDGKGLATQEEATRLALALAAWLESDWPKGQRRLKIEVTPGSEHQIVETLRKKFPGIEVVGDGYGVDLVDDILDFLLFLEHCGGFTIS